jgi:hypothetical protein
MDGIGRELGRRLGDNEGRRGLKCSGPSTRLDSVAVELSEFASDLEELVIVLFLNVYTRCRRRIIHFLSNDELLAETVEGFRERLGHTF